MIIIDKVSVIKIISFIFDLIFLMYLLKKHQSALLLFFLLFSIQEISAQDIPDYPERKFQDALDSLEMGRRDSYSIEATEGSIDPNEYRVGPGDKIFISISGVKEVILTLVINQEGWLYIPKVGGVNLRDHTLAAAKEEIIQAIYKYYKDVDIFISLKDFRKIKVSLTGDIVKPSNFVLTANARLMDLIDLSSGLNNTANLRNIKVISKDSISNEYDFLSFLRFGYFEHNPILREGDFVIIDKADEVVRISGDVKYPAIYEYLEGESVSELINLAGGFLSKAKTDTIEVINFLDEGTKQQSRYYTLNQINEDNILLKVKDHVIVRELPDYYIEQYVKLDGFVQYPGWYKLIKNQTTLVDIINEAGGFKEEASLSEATLTRRRDVNEIDSEFERLKLMEPADMTEDEYDYFKSKSRQSSERVVIDFVDLFVNGNMNENVFLKRDDKINVPEQKNYIIMLGQFVNPGKIIFNPELTVRDYIELAGGFGFRAKEGEVRVIKANTGEWIEEDDVRSLEPGDTIWVPEDPPGPKFWDVFLDGLQILAQVAAIVAAAAALVVATR
jgi:protein involved in polysaccharide export with SLBB domain